MRFGFPRRRTFVFTSQVVFAVTRIPDTSAPSRPVAALIRFGRREDGSLTIFGLLIFILMMTAGGIALDIMRSEVKRTELQYAVDRASLAAAGLDQDRDAEAIVKDYIRAAGLDENSVTVDTGDPDTIGFERVVNVSANAVTNSLFLDLLGFETLIQPVSSEAKEVRTELELSLVLDVSGSMGGAKIETLRTAASDFVAELLRNREDLTSISLVPYNDRVNAGSLITGVFDVSDEHPYSNCIVFSDAEFGRLEMGPGDELRRMGHFDINAILQNRRSDNSPGLVEDPNCRTDDYASILPWSNNVVELQRRIAGLNASHWTAMDLGVKWGSLLLDPSSRDELGELATRVGADPAEDVDMRFVGRPVAYNTNGTHKVLVVMTDGTNTQQWDLRAGRKDGASGMFVFRESLSYVCRDYERNRYNQNGSRSDGLGSADADLCDGWDDAGRPAPYDTATGAPVLDLSLGLGLVEYGGSGNRAGLQLDMLGAVVPVNLFGANGSGCNFGTGQQRALCRANFDNDEDHRWVTRYSVWSPQVGGFWVPHRWQYWRNPYGGSNATRLDWSEVFASLPISYIANDILRGANWNTRVDYFNSWETTHGQASADENLSRICAKAREAGVVIYTIAFQAEEDGEAAMLDCAGEGNEARYFDVEDLDIAAAFDDVLASVSRLRLTQ